MGGVRRCRSSSFTLLMESERNMQQDTDRGHQLCPRAPARNVPPSKTLHLKPGQPPWRQLTASHQVGTRPKDWKVQAAPGHAREAPLHPPCPGPPWAGWGRAAGAPLSSQSPQPGPQTRGRGNKKLPTLFNKSRGCRRGCPNLTTTQTNHGERKEEEGASEGRKEGKAR